jgi:hypothetical protein
MSDIANLQEAVETARAAYARASEQHARSRKHAMSLIHIIEEQVREKRIELSQNDVQRERMTREYGQLRQMLHALVMDVEVGATEDAQNVVTPLAPVPVPVANDPREPVFEVVAEGAAEGAAERGKDTKPSRRKSTKAENGATGAGAEELRAGLKRMLKKKRAPEAEITPAPAE